MCTASVMPGYQTCLWISKKWKKSKIYVCQQRTLKPYTPVAHMWSVHALFLTIIPFRQSLICTCDILQAQHQINSRRAFEGRLVWGRPALSTFTSQLCWVCCVCTVPKTPGPFIALRYLQRLHGIFGSWLTWWDSFCIDAMLAGKSWTLKI